jgi:hypothetical protein
MAAHNICEKAVFVYDDMTPHELLRSPKTIDTIWSKKTNIHRQCHVAGIDVYDMIAKGKSTKMHEVVLTII